MGDAALSSTSSSSAVNVTKISRRKVFSMANGDIDLSLNRYQVYRGLSPETSNRLEVKIQELEEELQAERQARLASQQQCTYLTEEIQLQAEHYEGLEGRISGHTDILRMKDQELHKLKQEVEALMERNESTEVVLRKKQQETVNELNEQLDHLTKQRNRSDADKRNLLVEIGELGGSLEKAQAAKAHSDSKVENLEAELRRLHLELEEKSRQLHDASGARSKLVHDGGELHSRIKQLESSLDGVSRDRQKLQREVENLKESLLEAEAEKPHLISSANILQVELSEVRTSLEDEQQRNQMLASQFQKLQSDFANFRAKADKDLAASNEDNEAIRKKYTSRIAELEGSLNLFQKKSSKVEKEHSKLILEIRELIDELEKGKAATADIAKKLRQSESLNAEQKYETEQLSSNFHQLEATLVKQVAEVAKMKSMLTEKDDRCENLAKDLKAANDRAKELKQEGDEAKVQVQDMMSIKIGLDREVTRLNALLSEQERRLAESRRSLEASMTEAKQTRDELNAELRLKEEEINVLKKTNQKLTDDHNHHLMDFEARHKSELSRTKKLLESELLELSSSCDAAVKSQAELTRANKALANRVKELEGALLNEERTKEDLRGQVNSAERRRATAQTELDQLLPRLDSAEHGRKMAELNLHELEQRVSELSISVASAANDARRHEAEANALRVALEESNSTRRDLEERVERLRMEVEGASEAFNVQLELGQEKDSIIKQLERDLKEARCALEEVEQNALREGKKLLGKVQARCKSLEIDIDVEQRKARESQAEVKRLARIIQEVMAAKDADVRELVERTNQLESALANSARLKKQLMEAEEVITVVTSKYRRLQHQLQEASEQQSSLQDAAATSVVVSESRGVGLLPAGHGLYQGLAMPMAAGLVSGRVSVARSYVSSSSTLANRL